MTHGKPSLTNRSTICIKKLPHSSSTHPCKCVQQKLSEFSDFLVAFKWGDIVHSAILSITEISSVFLLESLSFSKLELGIKTKYNIDITVL